MLIRPRLSDHHGIMLSQAETDFAIPFLDEDIPLYVDPFLLWRSPSQQDQMFHTGLINAFNHLGSLAAAGQTAQAANNLIIASECDEVGLGTSASKKGKRIGRDKAEEIISLFSKLPNVRQSGFRHFEEIQLFVAGISKDRVSDIACSFLKSVLIDYTIDQCKKIGMTTEQVTVEHVYDYRKNIFGSVRTELPTNPTDHSPVIFVPKRWLRFVPWINFDEYFVKHCPHDEINHKPEDYGHVEVLNFNREN